MRSIAGFNGSSVNGSFSAGQPISANELNKLATGIDITRTMMSNDIQFQGNTGGTAYALPQQVYDMAVGEAVPCPLQIYGLFYDTELDQYFCYVSPGHVNNVVVTDGHEHDLVDKPKIRVFQTGLTGDATTNYIYIACRNGGDPPEFPTTDEGAYIYVTEDPETDTDEVGYFLIGVVIGSTDIETDIDTLETTNYKGCGSLWAERFKCGDNPAIYWWSAV